MAKWTLSEYIYQVRSRLDEFDEELYSDAEITAYINEAVQKMASALQNKARRTLSIERRDAVHFKEIFISDAEALKPVINDRTHNLAEIYALYFDGDKLDQKKPEDVEKGEKGYYFWGEQIVFGETKTGTIKAMYVAQPKYVTNTTETFDIPERYQAIPLEYAQGKAKEKDGEFGQADYLYNRFFGEVEAMRKQIEKEANATGISQISITNYDY